MADRSAELRRGQLAAREPCVLGVESGRSEWRDTDVELHVEYGQSRVLAENDLLRGRAQLEHTRRRGKGGSQL